VSSFYKRGGKERGIGDGYDLIIVTVKNHCGHVYPLQIFGAVRFRESLDAVEDGFVSREHSLKPEGINQAL
jgi:hypothetical protein